MPGTILVVVVVLIIINNSNNNNNNMKQIVGKPKWGLVSSIRYVAVIGMEEDKN